MIDRHDEEQAGLARAAVGVATRLGAAKGFTQPLWAGLAELGVLALATPEGGGSAAHVVAALDALGSVLCPGPIVPALLATQLLDGDERRAVASGAPLVGVGQSGDDVVAWGGVAGIFLLVEGHQAWVAEPADGLEPYPTLAGEPWARGRLRPVRPLGDTAAAFALAHLAVAAWVTGAAAALLQRAAEHARNRRQFGRAIGDFQAVAHRLAACDAAVESSRALVGLAAAPGPADETARLRLAAAARLAAVRAGLDTAFAAHQVFGAVGFTVEAGIGRWSAAIRQYSLLPPGPRAVVATLCETARPVSLFPAS